MDDFAEAPWSLLTFVRVNNLDGVCIYLPGEMHHLQMNLSSMRFSRNPPYEPSCYQVLVSLLNFQWIRIMNATNLRCHSKGVITWLQVTLQRLDFAAVVASVGHLQRLPHHWWRWLCQSRYQQCQLGGRKVPKGSGLDDFLHPQIQQLAGESSPPAATPSSQSRRCILQLFAWWRCELSHCHCNGYYWYYIVISSLIWVEFQFDTRMYLSGINHSSDVASEACVGQMVQMTYLCVRLLVWNQGTPIGAWKSTFAENGS